MPWSIVGLLPASVCAVRRRPARSQLFSRRKMKRFKVVAAVGCIALMGAILTPTAIADDSNKKTVVTFSGPVEIPGVHLAGWGVLPAGTYVFKIVDSHSDRHIVQ